MRKPLLLLTAGGALIPPFALLLFTLPLLRRLPMEDRTSLKGITTLQDAIEECRRSGLSGLALALHAQHLVARKFADSRLNPLDLPARAFERGSGSCLQQALALKKIYDGLGIPARLVYATKVRFPAQVVNGTLEPERIGGHAWLRVLVNGEELDICPGSAENMPDDLRFEVLSEVRTASPLMMPFLHLSSVIKNRRRHQRARRRAASQQA